MPKLLDEPDSLLKRRTHFVWDDFYWFVTVHGWTKTVADVAGGVGIAGSDAAGGILTIGTEDSTDNDEVILESTQEVFLFANNKPIHFMARCQYTEINTDDANIFIGLMNAPGANSMIDDGAGPVASFSGMGFYKVDGGTRWQCISSIGTTRNTTDLTAALSLDKVAKTAGGASYQVFECLFDPYSSTNAKVQFLIDGVLVAVHDFVYTSATEMSVAFVVKNGGANPETLLLDYVGCAQLR